MELVLFHAARFKEKTTKEGILTKNLSKKDAKLTAQAASNIYHILPRKTKIEVWSNMEPHLSQTADIIADELDVKRKYLNAIGRDDIQELLNILPEHAKEKCIIIVGEYSFLHALTSHLTNTKLPLAKYSAVWLDLDLKKITTSKLLWFVFNTAQFKPR